MPYELTLPDGSKFRTDDMDADDVVKIARESDSTWAHVTEAPVLGDGAVMLAVYRRCCELAGVEAPAKLTFRTVIECFRSVDDDRPTEFDVSDEGFVSVSPPEGDAPQTT